MQTIIKMADGEQIRLNSEFDGVVRILADALDRPEGRTDERNRRLPRGFVRFETTERQEVVVNAAQVDSVRPEEQQVQHGSPTMMM